jgi:hypothetical protein
MAMLWDTEFGFNQCLLYDHIKEWKLNDSNNIIRGIHINIRSINKNWYNFIAYINNSINQIDFIVITETFLKNNEESKYKIDHFRQFSKHRSLRDKSRGGGILIYVKKELKSVQLQDIHCDSFETLAVLIHDITLVAIYRPPDKDKFLFITELENETLKFFDNNIIIMGDINLNLLLKSDPVIMKYENKMANYGLVGYQNI